MMDENQMVAMEDAVMTAQEKEEALAQLADYLAHSEAMEIDTALFCQACETLGLDAFAFTEAELAGLEEKMNQVLAEEAKTVNDWVEIDDEALNRLAIYLVSFTDGHIDTEVFYTACLACKMDPHAVTDAHMAILQEKIDAFNLEINGTGEAFSNEARLDQIAQYLAMNIDGEITDGVVMNVCYQFGVDPYELNAQDLAALEAKINRYEKSGVVDEKALDRLAQYIVTNLVEEIDTEALYHACQACDIDPYALDDQALMLLQGKLNALSEQGS